METPANGPKSMPDIKEAWIPDSIANSLEDIRELLVLFRCGLAPFPVILRRGIIGVDDVGGLVVGSRDAGKLLRMGSRYSNGGWFLIDRDEMALRRVQKVAAYEEKVEWHERLVIASTVAATVLNAATGTGENLPVILAIRRSGVEPSLAIRSAEFGRSTNVRVALERGPQWQHYPDGSSPFTGAAERQENAEKKSRLLRRAWTLGDK